MSPSYRIRSIALSPIWLVAPVLALASLTAGCGAEPDSAGAPPAATWQRIDDGWARAVPLDPPLVLAGARPGDALEAVVLPSGPGDLVVVSKAGTQRVPVTTAARVVVPLAKGGPVTVSFDGAAAAVQGPRIAAAASKGEGRTGEGRTGEGSPLRPRRILLVVIDTLRADAVTPETAPELLDFFAEGQRFTRAYSTATWTLPSVASILTGKAPTELALPNGTLIALAAGEGTIASDLAQRGFHTVGISSNYTVNHENGFSGGFDLFLAPAVLGHGDWPDAAWVLDRARRTLEWFPDRDLFLYLHLMEPHDPYRNEETGEVLAPPSTGTPLDAAAVERMRLAYASETRRVTGLLAEFLREAGPFERVVVTADHGEEFLEHGGFKHGPTVYPEVSRVPLLVWGGGVVAGTADDPISLLEVRDFLTAQSPGGLEASGEDGAEIVSFVHAAPRFSWAHPAGQTVLFARDLELEGAAEGGHAPAVAGEAHAAAGESLPVAGDAAAKADPIGVWLRAHHPAIDFVDAAGAPRVPFDGEALEAALRLARRFHRLRPGRWILVPAGVGPMRLELEGAASGGWWWGAAESVALTRPGAAQTGRGAPPPAILEVTAPDPLALVFVPGVAGAEGRSPSVRSDQGTIEEIPDPPRAVPVDRALTWLDPGRPKAALEGVEETMRRLRAQGYL